jgi:hypothetical protein
MILGEFKHRVIRTGKRASDCLGFPWERLEELLLIFVWGNRLGHQGKVPQLSLGLQSDSALLHVIQSNPLVGS